MFFSGKTSTKGTKWFRTWDEQKNWLKRRQLYEEIEVSREVRQKISIFHHETLKERFEEKISILDDLPEFCQVHQLLALAPFPGAQNLLSLVRQ